MTRAFYIMLFLCILGIALACRKEELKPKVSHQTVAKGSDLKSVYFIGPTVGFVAGGRFEQEGYIYKTTDGGSSWQLVFSSDWSVNAVKFLNTSEGYACGDSLHILKTTDEGITWKRVKLSWYPYPEYLLPLKHIEFADDTTWYITGGRNYQYGVNVRTQNGGLWWDMEVFQVELNTAYFRDEKRGLIAGYGVIYITPDANVTFDPTGFTGDHITSLSFNNPDEGFACGFDGGIYETRDGGVTWETRVKPNGSFGQRIHFNALDMTPNSGVAVGALGTVYYSASAGNSWIAVDIGMNNDLMDVVFLDDRYIVVGEDGAFIRIMF